MFICNYLWTLTWPQHPSPFYLPLPLHSSAAPQISLPSAYQAVNSAKCAKALLGLSAISSPRPHKAVFSHPTGPQNPSPPQGATATHKSSQTLLWPTQHRGQPVTLIVPYQSHSSSHSLHPEKGTVPRAWGAPCLVGFTKHCCDSSAAAMALGWLVCTHYTPAWHTEQGTAQCF